MARPYYPSNRLSSETARIRYDAIDDQFSKPGGTQLYSTDSLGLPVDPQSQQGMQDQYKVTKSLAESSMPVSHLNGLQFVHVLRAAMPANVDGLYVPRTKTMAVDGGFSSKNPQERSAATRTMVHETGHHVENMTYGLAGGNRGHSEGVAENYAEAYAPERGQSNYDAHAGLPESTVFNSRRDPTGQQNRAAYVQARRQGLMPWE